MEEQKKQAVKEFLTAIIPDIENIDGGCYSCIDSFCNNVNETLEAYSLRLESNRVGFDVTVTLTEIPTGE